MENIVVVDAVSTGFNLVDDVIRSGYHPVVVNITSFGKFWLDKNAAYRPKIEGKCDFIDEQPVYEDTLRLVRAVKPRIVLPGSEAGVELATRLAEDLCLPGNPTSILPQMKEKAAMHEALRKHGLRYIRGKKVSSAEEAVDFYDELGVKRVVVKQNIGDASVGMHICSSRDQLEQIVRNALAVGKDHYEHTLTTILVQEMIEGTEYIVNTATCNGKTRVTSLFRYRKDEFPDGRKVNRYGETINEIGFEHIELIQYAYNTIKAIGIKYGVVHGEYFLDKDGPVLLEVNCRPMGAGLHADYMDLLNGQHETDSHLMCYLDPKKFEEEAKKPYRTNCKLVLKHLMASSDKELIASPILAIAPRLKSYKYATLTKLVGGHLKKTTDLSSDVGIVYLAHPDSRVVMRDVELLCKMEDYMSEMLYQEKAIPDIGMPENFKTTEISDIVSMLGFGDKYTVIDMDNNKDQKIVVEDDHYDNVILDHSLKSWTIEDSLGALFDLVKSMKKGSRLVMTGKIHFMDRRCIAQSVAAMQFAGLTIEVPLPDHPDLLIGTVDR